MELTAVVPTYRRPGLLRACLESLAHQDLDQACFEVVVVDDGSEDGTAEVLASAGRRAPNLRSVSMSANRGPASARNRGIEEARGDLVLFLDDDVVAPPDLVSTHLRLHLEGTDPGMGVLGRVEWAPWLRVTPFMRWLDRSGFQFAFETWLREGPVEPAWGAFYTANLSLPRRLLLESGGFDESFPYANFEDVELAWRLTALGLRLAYRSRALAYHARAIDLDTFCRRMANEAESALLMRRVCPDFPIDEHERVGGFVRRRRRIPMGLVAPLATVLRREVFLDRYYRARISAAYLAGRHRGEARLEPWQARGTRRLAVEDSSAGS